MQSLANSGRSRIPKHHHGLREFPDLVRDCVNSLVTQIPYNINIVWNVFQKRCMEHLPPFSCVFDRHEPIQNKIHSLYLQFVWILLIV